MVYGGALCPHAHKFLLSPRALNLCRQNITRLQQFQTLIPLHSQSLPFNFKNSATPFKPTVLRLSALSNDGSGGNGPRGGSGGGGSDGPNSGGAGDGGDKWSFLYLALLGKYPVDVKALTSATLNLIGDLICQLVIDQVPSLDVKRTFVSTFLGFALVGPTLYFWLTEVFLTFDIFFITFCIGMACIVFFALFCIIPIIALAYAMRIREGASEEDIRSLPMYRFSQSNSLVIVDDNKKQLVKGRVDSCNGSHMSELSLHPDDSECCICLCPYVEGEELYRLPCTHHFHCGCIGRWLRTKTTCPLCKFNILRGDTLV